MIDFREALWPCVDVSPLDADLLDATVRLIRLIEPPAEYRAVAPLVTRESSIGYWPEPRNENAFRTSSFTL